MKYCTVIVKTSVDKFRPHLQVSEIVCLLKVKELHKRLCIRLGKLNLNLKKPILSNVQTPEALFNR